LAQFRRRYRITQQESNDRSNEFSGSASITNYSDSAASVRADFHLRGSGTATASETLSIAAGGVTNPLPSRVFVPWTR
jgi:hypothetical protein